MHSGVIMLTFAPVSKRTSIHFPLIMAYPMLSLPNQWDLASSFNMGIRFLECMHTATYLTFWEGYLPWPFWAALGASVLPHLVPPLSLNLYCPSKPVSGQGSCDRSSQSHHRCNITAPAVHNGMQSRLL